MEISQPKIEYYKHSSHATYNFTWHCVWITKYRKKVLDQSMQERLEKLIRWICKENYITVISLGFEEDHVHCLLSFPIITYIPDVFKLLKWRTSYVLRKEFKDHLKKYYKSRWNKHLWAVWYFFCSVWKVDEDTIRQYVENQGREECLWEKIEL